MDKLPHKIALMVALLSFIISLALGISIFEGIIRNLFVYIGVLFVFFVSGLFMKWGVQIMSPHNEVESEEDNLEEKKSEEMISEL